MWGGRLSAVRIATWNVNSLKVRLERVEAWLADLQPDVVCLQETKLADSAFPALAFQALGYESVHHGHGQWNGVAILSRVGLEDPQNGFGPGFEDPDARLIWATCGGIRIASAYVPNGRALDDDHYQYKLSWLAALRAEIAEKHQPSDSVIVAGDWNIAPTNDDIWSGAQLNGVTHVSQPERDEIAAFESWGFVDTFREQHQEPGLYSWWDYRGGSFHKKQGMRIDLLMATSPVAQRVRFATVDRNERKGKQPSDHAPVIIDLED